MSHDECGILLRASRSLLEKSGLVHCENGCFVPENRECKFESYWQKHFDCEFGRYMAWVWFSVGAENLLKAALMCRKSLPRKEPKHLGYRVFSPEVDKKCWTDEVLSPESSIPSHLGDDEAQKYNYRSLGKLLDPSNLKRLQLGEGECRNFRATYKYLNDVIRNRDAHTFVKDQRRKDFPAVGGIFVPAFNILVQSMEKNGHFGLGSDA